MLFVVVVVIIGVIDNIVVNSVVVIGVVFVLAIAIIIAIVLVLAIVIVMIVVLVFVVAFVGVVAIVSAIPLALVLATFYRYCKCFAAFGRTLGASIAIVAGVGLVNWIAIVLFCARYSVFLWVCFLFV